VLSIVHQHSERRIIKYALIKDLFKLAPLS
jgi:hypothetical protein